ncbi:hypothetical protein RJT34_08842 [Clitoria ternatea]|uniref:Uncharacterized protein n=1 Tax=Clitoria ternatea TaxID=43366 RepID=A0AAN9K890_CLITE
MASPSAAPSPGANAGSSKRALGFMRHAMKRKDSFIQLFAMTGIFLLSMRSLGQKYRIHNLEEDIHSLRQEHTSLSDRINNIKRDLLREASQDSTGVFASSLTRLFPQQL